MSAIHCVLNCHFILSNCALSLLLFSLRYVIGISLCIFICERYKACIYGAYSERYL